ncbi:MAG: methyltransferase domain-containing protein [Planctomycetota bacterium]
MKEEFAAGPDGKADPDQATRARELVRDRFGRTSDAYASSHFHAQGESLRLLQELTSPEPEWRVLDVATGAGHTAMTFAPFVDEVVATDITQQMLDKTAELATGKGITNLRTRYADAESLPFEDSTFDLVTCRLALHHFPDRPQAAREFFRVTKSGGVLGFTDNFTVDDEEGLRLYNEYEIIRDPSHLHVPSLGDLQRLFTDAGFQLEETRIVKKEFEFHAWADRQNVSVTDKDRLLSMMRDFPASLQEFFQPRWTDETMYFLLHEAVIIGKKI